MAATVPSVATSVPSALVPTASILPGAEEDVVMPTAAEAAAMVDELTKVLERGNGSFHEYNTTSVQYLLEAAVGGYGPAARPLALRVLNNFLAWYARTQKDKYLPTSGMETMYPLAALQEVQRVLDNPSELGLRELSASITEILERDPPRMAKLRELGAAVPKSRRAARWLVRPMLSPLDVGFGLVVTALVAALVRT